MMHNRLPGVTILTPTCRPAFLKQCAKYVARQTYPREKLEWVIVDSGNDEFQMPENPGLRIAVVHQKGAVGLLRNLGLRVACGELVVHFDDDDWHAPDRIERQVAPFLVKPYLDLVCTDDYHIALFDESPIRAMRSWSWGYEMFSSGGTFMYRRKAWERRGFAHVMTGEDYEFAKHLRLRNSMAAQNLRDSGLFVCVRHGKNTCDFDEDVRKRATTDDAIWVEALMGSTDFESTKGLVLR
jgi:glycosyltransferase involved in cell wall biosynthesis